MQNGSECIPKDRKSWKDVIQRDTNETEVQRRSTRPKKAENESQASRPEIGKRAKNNSQTAISLKITYTEL